MAVAFFNEFARLLIIFGYVFLLSMNSYVFPHI